jgi:hypothetical protein
MYEKEVQVGAIAKRERHIPTQVTRLGNAVGELENTIMDMVQRLETAGVLMDETAVKPPPNPTPLEPLPAMARELRERADRLMDMTRTLQNTLRRLEA